MPNDPNKYDTPRVSVIIPCKDEAASILTTLQQTPLLHATEVIIVDGESTDGTSDILDDFQDAHTIIKGSVANRASQMNQAAQYAAGDILLFLHADTLLPETAIAQIQQMHTSGIKLGCFRRRFMPKSTLLDFTSELAYWRSRLLFWSYGDQAIFIDANEFKKLGGYREMSRMEDLDLSLRAKKICPFGVIDSPIQTSARRFADAPLKRLLKDLALSLGYIFGLYRPK